MATAEMVLFQLAGDSKVIQVSWNTCSFTSTQCHAWCLGYCYHTGTESGPVCLQHAAFKQVTALVKESRPKPLPIVSML